MPHIHVAELRPYAPSHAIFVGFIARTEEAGRYPVSAEVDAWQPLQLQESHVLAGDVVVAGYSHDANPPNRFEVPAPTKDRPNAVRFVDEPPKGVGIESDEWLQLLQGWADRQRAGLKLWFRNAFARNVRPGKITGGVAALANPPSRYVADFVAVAPAWRADDKTPNGQLVCSLEFARARPNPDDEAAPEFRCVVELAGFPGEDLPPLESAAVSGDPEPEPLSQSGGEDAPPATPPPG